MRQHTGSGVMRLVPAVALGYAGLVRRLELVANDNIPIFDATSALERISFCAEVAPVASGGSLFSDVTRT